MGSELEQGRGGQPTILKKAFAGLVLVAVAALAVHFIIGLIMTVFLVVVVVAAILAIAWALNTLL